MAYGRQFQTTRADTRLRPDYTAALNRKLQYLPQRLAQQQAEKQHEENLDLRERQFAQSESQFGEQQKLKRRQMAAAERAEEAGMGLEAAKAGMGFSMRDNMPLKDRLGGGSVPPATAPSGWIPGATPEGGGKGLFSNIGKAGTFLKDSASKYLGNLTLGNTVGAGLTGFGASRLFGGDNKFKKFGIGAAAGGLMSLFGGGGAGTGAEDFVTGGLFGGIGGLF